MDLSSGSGILEKGCTVVIFGVPKGTEFGIDMYSWQVGDKFKGIKIIPPGLHFIYYRAVDKYHQSAPTTGFFHYFHENEVLVKNYNPSEEILYDETNIEKLESIKSNIRDLDSNLGPYPLDLWSKWVSFSQHISEANLMRLQPLSGQINSAPEYVNKDKFVSKGTKRQRSSSPMSVQSMENEEPVSDADKCNAPADSHQDQSNQISQKEANTPSHAEANPPCQELNRPGLEESNLPDPSECKDYGESRLPNMIPVAGTEIRFSKFPDKPYKEGASPAEVSKGSIDSTYTMTYILNQMEKPEDLLSEIQFSFVCFLVGQVLDGWEHWKKLIIAACNAENTLLQHPALYLDILSVLYYQIQEVPEDLFADIVENNNFLVASLRILFANISDNGSKLPLNLVSKATKFSHHISTKFEWNLELNEEGDDQPVVVEL